MARNESKTVQIIKNGLEQSYPDGFYTKIPDQGALLKYGIERPFDIVHSFNGSTIAIEVKTAKHPQCFNLENVKKHQIDNLLSMANNQNTSLVAIHLWMPRKTSFIYFIDIYDFLYWKNHSLTDSINWDKFEDNPHISFQLEVKSKKIFDKKTKKNKIFQYVDFKGTYIHR